jgi:hypothetical protein
MLYRLYVVLRTPSASITLPEKPFHIFKRAFANDNCVEAVTFGFASGQEVEAGAALA